MAVYTEVSDEDLAEFLVPYEVGELLSFRGIAEGVENTNYIVHTTTGPFILTLYEKRVEEADLPFFLGLMEHLAAKAVSCPVPLRDREGSNLNDLSGRKAALVSFLEGVWPRRPQPLHCQAVGEALAQMHLAGSDYERGRDNALGLRGWRDIQAETGASLEQIHGGLQDLVARELDHLEGAWPQMLENGVIHGDLFPDNAFFIGQKLSGLIDFYFACNDAFAYDLAICLNAWCFEPDYAFNVTKGRALLSGYQKVRVLSEAERAALPMLARGAALRFLLTRCVDWLNTPATALVKPHDPVDYVRRLRFHQQVSSITEYGLAA